MRHLRYTVLLWLWMFVPYLAAQTAGPANLTTNGDCISLQGVDSQKATVGIVVTGTWSGTLQAQGIINGQSAFNVQVTPTTSSTPQATITVNGGYTANVSGMNNFKVCVTAMASGTAVVSLNPSNGASARNGSGSGGGSFTAGGDLSGNSSSQTVIAIDGTSVPVNSAADQVLVTTASATGAWKSLSLCAVAQTYDTSTHTFGCNTGLAPLASPTFTGTPLAPTAAANTNTTQIATTAFVIGQGYAPLASPILTGIPLAPTAAANTNTTQIATTAFVIGQNYAPLASPTFTGTLTTPAAILNGNGAASTPALSLTGSPFTGGTGTTTTPLAYLNQGTAPTTWSTNGTEIGVNAPSGFTGNFLDFHLNGGASLFNVSSAGFLMVAQGGKIGFNGRSTLSSSSDGVLAALNSATSGFSRFIFGPGDTSHVALCSSGTALTVCLGDGSSGGSLAVNSLSIGGNPVTAASTPLVTSCNGLIGASNGVAYPLQFGAGGGSNVCTSTTVIELPMGQACTARNLYAKAGTAATTGTSVTVYKNNVATSLTAALGTDTGVHSDTSDTVSFTATDLWSVRGIPGQATETTQNIRAVFQCT